MNDKFEQYIESAKRVVLTPEEKAHIHAALLSAMRATRLEQADVRVAVPRWFRWYDLTLHPLPIILGLVVAISMSTSYAAEGTLPGDVLYPVKTTVNEEVRGWFAFSSKGQLAYEQNIAERRLEEAEQLAFHGRLNDETRAEIVERFNERASRVEEHIEKLEDESAVEASSDFEARLKAHGAILVHLTSKDAETVDRMPEKSQIVASVQARASSTARQRIKAEAKVKSKAEEPARLAAAKKLKDAREKIEGVRALALAVPEQKIEELSAPSAVPSEGGASLKMMAVVMEDQAGLRTETRLDMAEKILEEGNKKLEGGV